MRNFEKLAQTVASNWKVIDTDTLNYCKAVAQLIKERHTELTKGGDAKKPKAPGKKPRKTTSASEQSVKSDTPKEASQPRETSCIFLFLSTIAPVSLARRVFEENLPVAKINGLMRLCQCQLCRLPLIFIADRSEILLQYYTMRRILLHLQLGKCRYSIFGTLMKSTIRASTISDYSET